MLTANFEIPIRCFAVSVVVIRPEQDKYKTLLLRRTETLVGTWCQISGRIEEGESGWQAALRELREETGLVPARFYSASMCEQFYVASLDCVAQLPVFVAYVGADQSVSLNHEHDAFQWVSFADAKQLVPFPSQRRLFGQIEAEFVQRQPSEFLRISC